MRKLKYLISKMLKKYHLPQYSAFESRLRFNMSIARMWQSRRSLSLFGKFVNSKSQDISQEMVNKPTVTGSGPFVELPQFQSLGDPSHLLNVTIPHSATLNIRNGALVAINGDLADLASKNQTLPSGIVYQALHSSAPVSLIINGNNSTYSIVEVSKDERWTIVKDESLVAWSGFTLQLHPHQLLHKSKSVQTTGKGTIVLSGTNRLFELTLADGEEILVHPGSVIAFSNTLHYHVLNYTRWKGQLRHYSTRLTSTLSKLVFSLPRAGPLGSLGLQLDKLKSYVHSTYSSLTSSLASVKELQSLATFFARSKSFFYNILLDFVLRFRPIFFRVCGPARLLIKSDSTSPNTAIFSREEIRAIFHASHNR